MDYTYEDIAKMIDHSLLGPVMTDEELESGIQIAIQYNVASICIKPYYLQRCARAAGAHHSPAKHRHRFSPWWADDQL